MSNIGGVGAMGPQGYGTMLPGTLELPPRRHRRTQEMTIQRNRSSLEILMQMGFPKQRAERALAATGDKGVQLASDWLLSHVNDPTIDDRSARDYILYLCPVGQLQQEFLDFWQKSYQECGWNRAHNYFPHITLCSFFQAEDSLVSQLSHAIKKVAERVANPPDTVDFDYFSSTNFIGLFVTESFSLLLKQITSDFAEEMRKANVTVEPHRKQLHVSLAYQFPTDKKEKLEQLAKTTNLKSPVRWDLRLYSRDRGKSNCQVRKVLYTHVPGAPDELELCDGDFVYMNESELDTSSDGWYLGTSWVTGCAGMFPGIYTERTAETETWTMHRSIPIVGTDLVLKAENGPDLSMDNGTISRQMLRMSRGSGQDMSSLYINDPTKLVSHFNATSLVSAVTNHDGSGGISNFLTRLALPSSLSSIPEGATTAPVAAAVAGKPSESTSTSSAVAVTPSSHNIPNSNILNSPDLIQPPLLADLNRTSGLDATNRVCNSTSGCTNDCVRSTSPKQCNRIPAIDGIVPLSAVSANSKGPRQLYVVRHGERVDFTFGKDWVVNSFNSAGQYVRYDLNMPKSIPRRKGGPLDFSKDCPLTVQGHFQARLLGEAMKEKEIIISHIYSSPSLRCVETASSILESLGLELEINIEHGLFEWLGWFQLDALKFMSAPELREAGYNVSSSYTSFWPFSKYNIQETTEQFYERSCVVTKEILKRHENEGGNVMFVAHGLNLDSCTRQLVGQPARSQVGFHEILHKIPYCAMSVVQEATVVRDTWYLIEPPILPFAHTNNPKYNWTSLTTPGLV